ncbi:MAG: hypothetical protein JXB23_08555 [Candidatus Aminicenantes bacterium]|nr:hypothetical protein [Candidatus Aminicenantes bacterium]
MHKQRIFILSILIMFLFTTVFSLRAEEKEKTVKGDFLFGYRFVDTSGAVEKYKEDFNLDKGARLFNFNLQVTPNETLKNVFDRLDINAYNYGGDPYETLGISLQKYGLYRFDYNRKKSTYFYADQYEESPGLLYDVHTFDFERLSDTGSLKVFLSSNVDLFLNFDHYTKKGHSATSLDLNRVEFEFDRPIDEDFKEVAFGLNAHIRNYSFSFEERIQDYENANSYFLPSYEDGGSSARYPSSLDLFMVNQPYDLKTNIHTFRINARPFSSILIKGSAQLSNQDMNLTYAEEGTGIDYLDHPFSYSQSGQGSFERNIRLLNLDITYLLFDKLAVIGAVRSYDFDQTGTLTIDGEKSDMALGYNTLGFEGGLQYQFTSNAALTLGYRHEKRDLEGLETFDYEDKTTRNGLFGNLKWNPSRTFTLTLDQQYGSYDNPYSIISPSKFNRFRGTAKLNLNEFSLSTSYLFSKTKNDVYEELWESSRNQLNLRAGYHAGNVKIFAGYALIDVKHDASRAIAYPPGWSGPAATFPWEIMYEGKSNLWDASLILSLNERWKIGGYGNIYNNSGFWEISRTMLKAYVQYAFENGLLTQVGYRFVDYKEEFSGRNDYKANIFEISFGYRWDQ